MHLLEPTGIMTGGVFKTARMLSECVSFQRRVGAGSWHEALQKIYRWRVAGDPRVIEAAPPLAVLWPARIEFDRFAGGCQDAFRRSGQLTLVLRDTDKEQLDTESGDEFGAWVDHVLNELTALSGIDDRLSFGRVTLGEFPTHPGIVIVHSSQWEKHGGQACWDAWIRIVFGVGQ